MRERTWSHYSERQWECIHLNNVLDEKVWMVCKRPEERHEISGWIYTGSVTKDSNAIQFALTKLWNDSLQSFHIKWQVTNYIKKCKVKKEILTICAGNIRLRESSWEKRLNVGKSPLIIRVQFKDGLCSFIIMADSVSTHATCYFSEVSARHPEDLDWTWRRVAATSLWSLARQTRQKCTRRNSSINDNSGVCDFACNLCHSWLFFALCTLPCRGSHF